VNSLEPMQLLRTSSTVRGAPAGAVVPRGLSKRVRWELPEGAAASAVRFVPRQALSAAVHSPPERSQPRAFPVGCELLLRRSTEVHWPR
jgi:hypothetical protein